MKKKIIFIIIPIVIIILIIINYLYVNNYNFKLNGSDKILLNIGDEWKDPLYTIENNKPVEVINNVNYQKEGNYQIDYSFKYGLFTKKLTREITILDANQKTDFIFEINGDNPYYLMINHNYEEKGYVSEDKIDGILTNKVQVTNDINNNVEGTYEVKYQISNSNGITKTLTRKVIVYSLKFEGKLLTEEYAKENEISLTINDENYSYTILPDNTKTNERQIKYKVLENKNYLFNIYDNNNNYLNYEVNVTNIDNDKPIGSCILSLNNTGGKITVNASDNGKIQGYEYQYGNNKTELLTETTYSFNTMDEVSSVIIYDTAGNNNSINCKTIDNSEKQQRAYTLKKYDHAGNTVSYWFYEPKISKREKVPLVIYFHGAGGSASINAVNNIAIPKNIKDGEDFPYYVAAPYKATKESFVLDFVDYLVQNYQIDSKRIVLSGGSAGSPAALNVPSNNPNKFSGIVIISGIASATNINANKLTNIPIWIFQGSGDNYKTMSNYVDLINNAGGNAKITSYKGGHDAPVNAFLRTDLTNWILTNKTK